MKRHSFFSFAIVLIACVFYIAACTAAPAPALGVPSGTPEASAQPAQSEQPSVTPEAPENPADELIVPDYDVQTSLLWDLNGDGTRETVSVGLGGAGDIGNDILLSVSDNGAFNTITVDSGFFESADYLVTPGGAPCVIVCCSFEDDLASTAAVSFDGLKPVLRDSAHGVPVKVSGSGMEVSCNVNALGTWPCFAYYGLTDEFTFEGTGDFYIDNTGRDPLITKGPVTVGMFEDDYAPSTLEAGISLFPYQTDGKTYMNFFVNDYPEAGNQTLGVINFTKTDGKCFIDGVSEYDCFETLPYAG